MARKLTRASRPSPMRSGGADLHVHTTHSDGSCTPRQVVRAAATVGLTALAITDHDTLSGIADGRDESRHVGVELIGGVEITAEQGGREIHILGHFVHEDNPRLRRSLEPLGSARAARFEDMAARLRSLGYSVDLGSIRQAFPRATLGRKHLAEWLRSTRQVPDVRAAFAGLLRDGGPIDCPKLRLSWNETIELIREACGVASLAHPPYDLRFDQLAELAEGGLGGLEVQGPRATSRLVARRRAWAERLNLIPIAGTDFHAPDRPGRWVGAIATPDADLERLRSASRSLATTLTCD